MSIVYLGDDRTDEDAFTALADDDVAIGVGERPHTHLIDSRLEGPGAVGRFFATFAQLRTGIHEVRLKSGAFARSTEPRPMRSKVHS